MHHTESTASMGSSGTTSWSSPGQESPRTSSQCYLGPGQPMKNFGTHGISSGSHICINARMTPTNPLLQSSGPNPSMVIWLQDVRSTKNCPYPLIYQDKPKFGKFKQFKWFFQIPEYDLVRVDPRSNEFGIIQQV